MQRLLPVLLGVAALAAPVSHALAQGAGGAVQLLPHRAVYDFTLGSARGGNTIASLTGRMVYEFTGSACDGYNQTMRFVTRTSTQTGEIGLNDQRTTSWEDETGRNFKFQSSHLRDNKMIDQTAGTAARPAEPGADTRVNLSHPDKRASAVGGGALFPIQHSIKLLEAARRGQTTFSSDFYDGSEGGEKTYIVRAMIGRQSAAGINKSLPRAGQSEKLDAVPAWPIALSYFEQGSERKDAVPAYEMSFLMFANGVSRRLLIDNGEYTMKGEMTQFEIIEQAPCKRK